MKYQKRLRATTLFFANRFMRYTLHIALSSGYFSLGTKRPTTWYCDWPVGKLAAFFPIPLITCTRRTGQRGSAGVEEGRRREESLRHRSAVAADQLKATSKVLRPT